MLAYFDLRLGIIRAYNRIKNMNKNYVLIFLKNTGATAKWVALTPPPIKRIALTLPYLISEYYYILIYFRCYLLIYVYIFFIFCYVFERVGRNGLADLGTLFCSVFIS